MKMITKISNFNYLGSFIMKRNLLRSDGNTLEMVESVLINSSVSWILTKTNVKTEREL